MPKLTSAPQNPESLRAAVAAIQIIAQRIDALAAAMEDTGVELLEITNYADLNTGMERLQKFADAGHHALRQFRIERGDFRAQNAPNPPAKPSLKAKRSKAPK